MTSSAKNGLPAVRARSASRNSSPTVVPSRIALTMARSSSAQRRQRDLVVGAGAGQLRKGRSERVATMELVGAVGANDPHVEVGDLPGKVGEEAEAVGIRPVQVLHYEHAPSGRRKAVEELPHGSEQVLLLRRLGREALGAGHLGEEGGGK